MKPDGVAGEELFVNTSKLLSRTRSLAVLSTTINSIKQALRDQNSVAARLRPSFEQSVAKM